MNKTELEYGVEQRERWERLMRIGRKLNEFLEPVRELRRTERIGYVEQSRAAGGRLSPRQLDEVRTYLTEVRDRELRRDYFKGRPVDKTLSGLVMPLARDVLARDSSVASVLNIGAYYAFVDHELAREFPKVHFTAMDLLPDMAGYNEEFARPNLAFASGYALEELEEGRVRADATMFSATAAEIMNAELRRYLAVLARTTRYVILSEPIYPLATGEVLDPARLPLDRSVPAYIQPEHLPHSRGPTAFVHNYRAMLAEAGFSVAHYHVFRPEITDLHWLHLIAERSANG